MLIFQTRSQEQHDKTYLVAELNSFLQKPRNTKFVPEYQYKTFFFNSPNIEKSEIMEITAEHVMDVRAEQYKIAGEILRASKMTNVVFYTENSKVAQSLASDLVDAAAKKIKSTPANELEMQLGRYILSGRIKFVPGSESVSADWWAQDLGEPTGAFVSSGGKSKPEYITSLTGNLYGWGHAVPMKSDASVVQIPACLAGGNFTKTICKEKRLCIVGANDVIETSNLYSSYGLKITLREVTDIYKKAFGSDDVLVLGKENGPIGSWKLQPHQMPHIDQAVFFPKEGVAVIVSPPKEMEKERAAVNGYKTQLIDAGFEIIEIPTTKERIEKYQAYTNSITISPTSLRTSSFSYKDGPEGESMSTILIMPSFDYKDGLEERIRSILEEHGFKVIFVPDKAFKHRGNTHCITGALSYNDMVPQFYKQAMEKDC